MDDLFPVQNSGVGARRKNTGLDFYETPDWATRALVELENPTGNIWEPCCGTGAISNSLNRCGLQVFSSDMEDRGFGSKLDFLRDDAPVEPDWIITNPPYFCAERCIARAIHLTRKRQGKVAFLMRLAFLEGQGRYEFFQETPPARVWVFSRRVNFIPGKSSAMPVAWFVWDHQHEGKTTLGWIA